jgi:hypothetical protein
MASAVASKTSAAAHMFSSIALLRTVVLLLTFDLLQFVVSSPFLAPLTSCVDMSPVLPHGHLILRTVFVLGL